MRDIEADADLLAIQASHTTAGYLRDAVTQIDACFGEGYAKANPLLVAAFIRTSASDFHSAILKVSAQDIRDALFSFGNRDQHTPF